MISANLLNDVSLMFHPSYVSQQPAQVTLQHPGHPDRAFGLDDYWHACAKAAHKVPAMTMEQPPTMDRPSMDNSLCQFSTTASHMMNHIQPILLINTGKCGQFSRRRTRRQRFFRTERRTRQCHYGDDNVRSQASEKRASGGGQLSPCSQGKTHAITRS